MRHLEVERWRSVPGLLHKLDARAKLIAVLAMLVFIATARPWTPMHAAFYAVLALSAMVVSRLPWAGLLRRLAVILPFTATFAALAWISTGDATRAAGLISRSLVSAAFAVVLIGVTPVPSLLDGAGRMGAPVMLISVAQFLYRYLFVLFDQALRMKQAAACRGGLRWDAASGAAAALFVCSQERATRIHGAMLARGFQGASPTLDPPRWRGVDTILVVGAMILLGTARIVWGL